MKKSINSTFLTAAIFALFVFVSPVMAETENGTDDTISVSAAAAASAVSTAVINGGDDVVTPQNTTPVGGTGTSGAVTNGDDDTGGTTGNTGGGTSGTVTNGDDDTTTTPPNNNGGTTPPGGGNGGGGGAVAATGSSGSFSSGGSVASSNFTPTVLGASTTGCPLITSYLKLGGNNDGSQVAKLQIFMKNSEGMTSVITDGIFGQNTEDAVKSFQKKYLSDILGPWDATRPTGFVYITTSKKINELACAQPITLSAEEQAIIEAYKVRTSQGIDETGQPIEIGSTVSTTTVGTVNSGATGSTDDANVAAAAQASVMSRFWDFIQGLFQ